MPAVPGAEGADLLLLERDGALHAVPADAVALTPRPALDGARRLAQVAWQPSPALRPSPPPRRGPCWRRWRRAPRRARPPCWWAWPGVSSPWRPPTPPSGSSSASPSGRSRPSSTTWPTPWWGWSSPAPPCTAPPGHSTRATATRPVTPRWPRPSPPTPPPCAARTALQVHGAIGYTWEHDLQLWMKRAWALAAAWGDAAEHRARFLEGSSVYPTEPGPRRP